MKLKPYGEFFESLQDWAFRTAVTQVVWFLFMFVLLCFAFSVLTVQDETLPHHNIFISKYQKYFTLAGALFFLVPFLLSLILIIGVLHKHQKILNIWFKISIPFSALFGVGALGNGIYLTVEGSRVGYATIPIAVVYGGLMVHSILLIYYLMKDYQTNTQAGKISEDHDNVSVKSDI